MADFYFAYGSNMNPARVAERGLRVRSIRGARMQGVRLAFDKASRDHPGVGHANLSWDRECLVAGVLYELEGVDEIAKMDVFERTPVNYTRERVIVDADGEAVVAWTYFANPAVRRAGLRPDRTYLAHLLAGRPYLPADYVQWLERVPCVDD